MNDFDVDPEAVDPAGYVFGKGDSSVFFSACMAGVVVVGTVFRVGRAAPGWWMLAMLQ